MCETVYEWCKIKEFSHSCFLELKRTSGVVCVRYTFTLRSSPNHNYSVLPSFVQGGCKRIHCFSDVPSDVCYCARNKESARLGIGRLTFPLFLVGL